MWNKNWNKKIGTKKLEQKNWNKKATLFIYTHMYPKWEEKEKKKEEEDA